MNHETALHSWAKQFARRYRHRHAKSEDLYQESMLAGIRALKAFDATKGPFENYAKRAMARAAREAARQAASPVGAPKHRPKPVSARGGMPTLIYSVSPDDALWRGAILERIRAVVHHEKTLARLLDAPEESSEEKRSPTTEAQRAALYRARRALKSDPLLAQLWQERNL